jgi:hypothetical protein
MGPPDIAKAKDAALNVPRPVTRQWVERPSTMIDTAGQGQAPWKGRGQSRLHAAG